MQRTTRSTSTRFARLAVATAACAGFAAVPATAAAGSLKASRSVTITSGVIKASGGTAVVTLDPALVSGATTLGITLTPVAPATANGAAWTLPVTSGRIAWLTRTPTTGTPVTSAVGVLALGGGITASKGSTTVTLGNFVAGIVPGNGGLVDARVNGSRNHLPALHIGAVALNPAARTATANLAITRAAAVLLNRTLSTTSFKAGMKVGSVAITIPAPA